MTAPAVNTIRQCILEVLEQFALMVADLDERRHLPASTPPYFRATIQIHSDQALILTLLAPRRFCESLAANALGIEGAVQEDTAQDALKEILNITAGRLSLDLFGTATAIPLTIPQLEVVKQEVWDAATKDPTFFQFNVEGNPLIANLRNASQT